MQNSRKLQFLNTSEPQQLLRLYLKPFYIEVPVQLHCDIKNVSLYWIYPFFAATYLLKQQMYEHTYNTFIDLITPHMRKYALIFVQNLILTKLQVTFEFLCENWKIFLNTFPKIHHLVEFLYQKLIFDNFAPNWKYNF